MISLCLHRITQGKGHNGLKQVLKPQEHQGGGILLIVLATLAFASRDTATKHATTLVPVLVFLAEVFKTKRLRSNCLFEAICIV